EKKLDLSCDASKKAPFVGDVRMVQRMLANIIDNAIKYTQPGGKVEVFLTESQRHDIIVSVKDTGAGIAGADLPRIFERFYRCDQSRSQAGTGLGLSLARAVARAHGGDITVTSTVDQGSTFTITLARV